MTVYNIHAFTQDVTDVVQPLLHGQDLDALTANSEAAMNIEASAVNTWLTFKTDAVDINDSNEADDLLFKTNSDAWGVTAFAGVATVDANAALSGVGNQTVEYDRVRWAARDIFGSGAEAGAYGVDLFNNEEALRADVSARDSNITAFIRSAIASANGLMMNNDTNVNIGRHIVLRTLDSNADRFKTDDLLNNSKRNGSGYYPFEFKVGDQINLKVTYKQASGAQIQVDNLGDISDHSYVFKMTVA